MKLKKLFWKDLTFPPLNLWNFPEWRFETKMKEEKKLKPLKEKTNGN